MKKLTQGLLLAVLMVSQPLLACTKNGEGFLPKNDLLIPVNQKGAAGLSEAQFNEVIDQVEGVYSPIVAQYGGKLEVVRRWTDPTVNAYAEREDGTWKVSMFGGLARHSTVTADGFRLVICHEIGHHIGGAPRYAGEDWASNEGEADYFATLKCLRRVWQHEDNAAVIRKLNAPLYLKWSCFKEWRSKTDRDICVRAAMAGSSVANLFGALGSEAKPAKFNTPDKKKVEVTYDAHPDTQCRLDTYFQGALCEKSFNEEIGQQDEVTGSCHGSGGQKIGLRPRCWFKPSVQ
jgi:hypothetical protein